MGKNTAFALLGRPALYTPICRLTHVVTHITAEQPEVKCRRRSQVLLGEGVWQEMQATTGPAACQDAGSRRSAARCAGREGGGGRCGGRRHLVKQWVCAASLPGLDCGGTQAAALSWDYARLLGSCLCHALQGSGQLRMGAPRLACFVTMHSKTRTSRSITAAAF